MAKHSVDLVVNRPRASAATSWFQLGRVVAALGLALLVSLAGTGIPAVAASQHSGYDISYPQCRAGFPRSAAGRHVVGVNGGRPFTSNPCFTAEYDWARQGGQQPGIYMNLDYPHGWSQNYGDTGPLGRCGAANHACKAYNYGYNAAADAMRRAGAATGTAWWLDVETDNYWFNAPWLNARVIRGALDYFHAHQIAIGIYSIGPMWRKIAGGYAPGVPVWVARWRRSVPTLAYCSAGYAFGGGTVAMVQSYENNLDEDYLCPGADWPTLNNQLRPRGEVRGILAGNRGGTSVQYVLPTASGQSVSLHLAFGPAGPDAANGLFIAAYQDGNAILNAHAIDTPTPGKLHLTFQSRSASPVVVRLTSYDDPAAVPPIHYSLSRD